MPNPRGPFNCSGLTTDGARYTTIEDMWAHELSAPHNTATQGPSGEPDAASDPDAEGDDGSANEHDDDDDDENRPEATWYQKSEAYWREQKASVEGMLGGLDALHDRDVAASRRFLAALPVSARGRALDVGAGIGRVSKSLLLPAFERVDLLEQSPKYVAESRVYLSAFAARDDAETDDTGHSGAGMVGRRIVAGMQDFRAAGLVDRAGVATGALARAYDVVWIQWCVIYLTDDDFVSFLRECVSALRPGGLVVLKDNVARAGFLVDKDDSSVMRSGPYLKSIFARAGLAVVKEQRQLDFPSSVFPVRMYALRPVGPAFDDATDDAARRKAGA